METKTFKRLPCGVSDFKTLITEDYAYVDKTRFIEMLENESNNCNMYLRPRKFGKTLFISMMMNYYDLNGKNDFDRLFGGLYIDQHPTEKRNRYAVIKFDFKGFDIMDGKTFQKSISQYMATTVRDFFVRYRDILADTEYCIRTLDRDKDGILAMQTLIYGIHQDNIKVYLFVDDGDFFARHHVATESLPEDYLTTWNSYNVVSRFYESIKTGKHNANIDRVFVSGVSSAGLGEASSLLYLNNLSQYSKYHDMIGFTQDEVDQLLIERRRDGSNLRRQLKAQFGGYRFSPHAENKIYHTGMTLYKINNQMWADHKTIVPKDEGTPEQYPLLKKYLQNRQTSETMIKISKNNRLRSTIEGLYPLEWIEYSRLHITHLFQLGLLTYEHTNEDFLPTLVIPNDYARCIFNHVIYQQRRDEQHKRILFLDIDGVLQPYGTEKRFDHITFKLTKNDFTEDLEQSVLDELYEKYGIDYGVYNPYDVGAVYFDWDKKSVAELKRILDTTGAKVIISSDWRDETIDRMVDLCKIHGLDEYIVDGTSKNERHNKAAWKKFKQFDYRSTEIMIHLELNPYIKEYVAVDDINTITQLGERHAVRTYDRLKPEDADKCIQLFNEQMSTQQ
jgi:hypothetical protein